MKSPILCPICGAANNSLKYVINGYHINACRNCHGGFTYPRPSGNEVSLIYGEEYLNTYLNSPSHGGNYSSWRFRQLGALLRKAGHDLHEIPGRSVIDIGCATGFFLSHFRNSGWETKGVEVSKHLAGFAINEFGLNVIVGGFLDVALELNSYNLVTMVHVIEHFLRPTEAMRKACVILNEGGMLFVETPNWDGIGARLRRDRWSHLTPPEHLNFLGPESMSYMARLSGFQVLSMVTVTPPYLESIQGLATFIKIPVQLAYSFASRIKRGPTLQVLLQKL